MPIQEVLLILRWLCNTLLHQCVALILVYGVWGPMINYNGPNTWHAILCTLGLFPCMTEAMLLFFDNNVWTQELNVTIKWWIHGSLMIAGFALIITGIAIKIESQDGSHFATGHGITGLLAMIALIIALISGPLALTDVLKFTVPLVWRQFIHILLSQLAFILTIAALCTGFYTDSFSKLTQYQSQLAATLLTCFLCVICCITSIKSEIKQIKSLIY